MAIKYEDIISHCKVEMNTNVNGALARINIDLVDPPITIKGFTIKDGISKDGKPYKCLSAPSYMSKGKYYPNIWMPKPLWNMLSDKVISRYEKQVSDEEIIDLESLEL